MKCRLKAVLCILKNATIIIPVLEGIVNTIHNIIHPVKSDEDAKFKDKTIEPTEEGYNYRDDEH